MIFRDGELKIVSIHYELTDNMGKIVKGEDIAGFIATSADEAIRQLRKHINKNVNIRINQIGNNGCVHVITDEVIDLLTNKTKKVKSNIEEKLKKKGGRPPGAKNKPKE